MKPVAALFVDRRGCYADLPAVEVWDVTRDARRYKGPARVVAHPPCERWGRFYAGSPMVIAQTGQRLVKGDDGGCFAAALAAVRRWGGVLEHPFDSSAWGAHGLIEPPRSGGWVVADFEGGWTCCVEQGHYGHRARKASWLYACGVELPSLTWGPSVTTHVVTTSRRHAGSLPEITKAERRRTPSGFRDLLLRIARGQAVGGACRTSAEND